MIMQTFDFGTLYNYVTKNGIVVPTTGSIKSKIESIFKSIFGNDLDVSAETPAGRFIEVLTLMFVNICGANASNANGLNPNEAVGVWLDNIGALFGIIRLEGESDAKFRSRILASQSRGFGYVQSIWNELSKIDTLTSICVLENGEADPSVLPNSVNGIAVDPHSIFVCVSGAGTNEEDEAIARAIYSTKSAGCAYTDSSEYGTKVEKLITDAATGSQTLVRFYRPDQAYVDISVTVYGASYTGVDIKEDAKGAVLKYLREHNTNTNITENDINAAISLSGLGIVCTGVHLKRSADGEIYSDVDSILLRPYEFINVEDTDVKVEVE